MNEVKTPKKPLIFYYVIVMLVLLLLNLPGDARHAAGTASGRWITAPSWT